MLLPSRSTYSFFYILSPQRWSDQPFDSIPLHPQTLHSQVFHLVIQFKLALPSITPPPPPSRLPLHHHFHPPISPAFKSCLTQLISFTTNHTLQSTPSDTTPLHFLSSTNKPTLADNSQQSFLPLNKPHTLAHLSHHNPNTLSLLHDLPITAAPTFSSSHRFPSPLAQNLHFGSSTCFCLSDTINPSNSLSELCIAPFTSHLTLPPVSKLHSNMSQSSQTSFTI